MAEESHVCCRSGLIWLLVRGCTTVGRERTGFWQYPREITFTICIALEYHVQVATDMQPSVGAGSHRLILHLVGSVVALANRAAT